MMKKFNKYSGMDTDKDMVDDGYEVMTGRHDERNKPRHINVGGVLPHNGPIIGIHHDNLNSTINHKQHPGKMKLTMNEPKKMPLSLNINNPRMNGLDLKKIKSISTSLDDSRIKKHSCSMCDDHIHNPVAELDDSRIKRHDVLFQQNWTNMKIGKILNKRKKKVR